MTKKKFLLSILLCFATTPFVQADENHDRVCRLFSATYESMSRNGADVLGRCASLSRDVVQGLQTDGVPLEDLKIAIFLDETFRAAGGIPTTKESFTINRRIQDFHIVDYHVVVLRKGKVIDLYYKLGEFDKVTFLKAMLEPYVMPRRIRDDEDWNQIRMIEITAEEYLRLFEEFKDTGAVVRALAGGAGKTYPLQRAMTWAKDGNDG